MDVCAVCEFWGSKERSRTFGYVAMYSVVLFIFLFLTTPVPSISSTIFPTPFSTLLSLSTYNSTFLSFQYSYLTFDSQPSPTLSHLIPFISLCNSLFNTYCACSTVAATYRNLFGPECSSESFLSSNARYELIILPPPCVSAS